MKTFECYLKYVWSTLYSKHCSEWSNDIKNISKLKFYMLYKSVFFFFVCIESYVVNVLKRKHRSILAQP